MDIGASEIREWHKAKGWQDIGYHYVITRDGEKQFGRGESIAGAHARGYNSESIGICLVGGINDKGDADANYTLYQYNALSCLLDEMLVKYPCAEIIGHRDLPNVSKACPCFDVRAFLDA